jgi:hypothetical protein
MLLVRQFRQREVSQVLLRPTVQSSGLDTCPTTSSVKELQMTFGVINTFYNPTSPNYAQAYTTVELR